MSAHQQQPQHPQAGVVAAAEWRALQDGAPAKPPKGQKPPDDVIARLKEHAANVKAFAVRHGGLGKEVLAGLGIHLSSKATASASKDGTKDGTSCSDLVTRPETSPPGAAESTGSTGGSGTASVAVADGQSVGARALAACHLPLAACHLPLALLAPLLTPCADGILTNRCAHTHKNPNTRVRAVN